MNKDIIFVIVFMVFAYIIGKYKLLPYFAAKKILKESKDGKKDSGNTAPVQMPFTYPYAGLPVIPTQPQPDISKHGAMYFEYTFIDLDAKSDEEINVFADVEIELLEPLRKRGICPNVFNIIYVGDGTALAYVTYVL